MSRAPRPPRWACVAVFALSSGHAWADQDTAAARAQLKQGYALKQQGKCSEAVAHFAESVRLDRQPKALLNLADCEQKLGKLSAAQAHTVDARDLAISQHTTDLANLASQRLQDLDKKLPKLDIKLTAGAPSDTIVNRDGVELGAISLGTPLPLDPGPHSVTARNDSFERRYDVTLTEGQTLELEVTPVGGKALPREVQASTKIATPVAIVTPASETTPPAATSWSGRQTGAVVLLGVGVVGIGVGAAMALSALSSWRSASANCPDNFCSDMGSTDTGNKARTRANLAAIPLGIGAVALVTGGVLWFTGKSEPAAQGLRVTPAIAASQAGIYLDGRF